MKEEKWNAQIFYHNHDKNENEKIKNTDEDEELG